MANRNEKEASRKRILSTCVRLFLEQGFKHTPPKQILFTSMVAWSGSVPTLKDTVRLMLPVPELTEFMFQNQFTIAGQIVQGETDPVKLYAVETAIQLTLAELNENLRQIYVEAYTLPENLEIIHRMTAEMLHRIFGAYMPGYSVSDFYESDIGSAAIMRGYMARPCDVYFTLERKLERFLQLTLRIYCVPEEKQREVMALIASLDIRAIANEVMQKLFAALEMHYEFTLGEEAKRI